MGESDNSLHDAQDSRRKANPKTEFCKGVLFDLHFWGFLLRRRLVEDHGVCGCLTALYWFYFVVLETKPHEKLF